MASCFGIKILLLAILIFHISIETSDAKKVCSLQVINEELQDANAEVHDIKPADKLEHGKRYWRWVCKDGSQISESSWTEIYEQKDEEPKRRVQRGWLANGWGSRRRSSYSSSRRRSSSGWESRRRSSYSSSRRRSSSGWGSRRRTLPSKAVRATTSTVGRETSRSRVTLKTRSPREPLLGIPGGKIPTQKSRPKSKSQKDKETEAWDKVHTTLDVIGLVPVIGNVADGINAGLHAARGNWKDAALSAAGMIPGAGQAAIAGKIAKKSAKALKGSSKIIKGLKRKSDALGAIDKIFKGHTASNVLKKIAKKEDDAKPKDNGLTSGINHGK